MKTDWTTMDWTTFWFQLKGVEAMSDAKQLNGLQRMLLAGVAQYAEQSPGKVSKLLAADESEVVATATSLLGAMSGGSLAAKGKVLVVTHPNGHQVHVSVYKPGEGDESSLVFDECMVFDECIAAKDAKLESDARIFEPTITQGPPPEEKQYENATSNAAGEMVSAFEKQVEVELWSGGEFPERNSQE